MDKRFVSEASNSSARDTISLQRIGIIRATLTRAGSLTMILNISRQYVALCMLWILRATLARIFRDLMNCNNLAAAS